MRRGATLMDLAIVMFISSFVIVIIANLWMAMANANAASSLQMKALVLAQSVMEKHVRAVPYGNLAPVSGTDSGSGLSYALTLTPVATGLSNAEVTITASGEPAALLRLGTLAAQVPPP